MSFPNSVNIGNTFDCIAVLTKIIQMLRFCGNGTVIFLGRRRGTDVGITGGLPHLGP